MTSLTLTRSRSSAVSRRRVLSRVRLAGLMALTFALSCGPPTFAQTPGPGGTARVVPTIALFSPAIPYALCPPNAGNRLACSPNTDDTSGAGAIDAIRTAALAPGVERIVLFLPGYRTALTDGHATAQRIADILGPHFLVVHVDWGSLGKMAGYRADGLAAKRESTDFAQFVSDLHAAIPQRELTIFAHSMGTRVAAGAMGIIKAPQDRRPFVTETVFAAPDLGLGDYERAVLRNPVPFGHVTIYVSRHDKALLVSSILHLGHRIGQLAVWRKTIADTSVVDASSAEPVGQGHGYALHDALVVRDIGAVFLDSAIPHLSWARLNPASITWTLIPAKILPLTEVRSQAGSTSP